MMPDHPEKKYEWEKVPFLYPAGEAVCPGRY
jgi:hypothetical protein